MKAMFQPLAVCGALLVAQYVSAQNLLLNPRFDNGLADWASKGGTATFDKTLGAPGSGGSGSVRVLFNGPARQATVLTQCVTGFSAGEVYSWGAKVYIHPEHAGRNVLAQVHLDWFSDRSCVEWIGGHFAPGHPVRGVGKWEEIIARGAGVPTGTKSASISAVMVTDPGHPFEVNFDDFYLVKGEVLNPTPTSGEPER